MRNKLIIFGVIIVGSIVLALTVFNTGSGEDGLALFTNVEGGDFTVEVTTTGELSAEKSVKIMGPAAAREYGIRSMTIQTLVIEGTQVKKGDFVAELDKGELYDKIQEAQDKLDAELTAFENAKLDTALTLRGERDKLLNLEYTLEERKLTLEQSEYEPPATVKKYKNDVTKTERDLSLSEENYLIKIEQAKAKMIEQSFKLKKARDRFNNLNDLLGDFTILAPQDGMVIYATSGFSKARVVEGSQVSPWSPQVAELPDLSSMISTTYINEVDIRKVKPGQEVSIGLDAFPEKKLTGKVIRVARVGQQNPNSDAKVFEVIVRLNESDRDLRPAMTTSNIIVTEELEEVMFIPLEALQVFNDSINYVIKKNGVLQEVKVGLTNSNDAVIEMGIAVGDELYLSLPASMEGKEPTLIPELNGTRQQKYELNTGEEEEQWLNADGTPMSPAMVERLKGMGINSASEAQDAMKKFGGGRPGGGRPAGTRPAASGAARTGNN